MSWSSRFGGLGRFSPFGRNANSSSAGGGEVSDSDFSYITSEDLASRSHSHSSGPGGGRHRSSSHAARMAQPEIVEWDDKNPDRDTDVLLLKHKRVSYPTHFPAHSIANGDLKIGTVRQAAAKKLDVHDSRKIRLFYRGRNMKFDDRPAREEGLRGDGAGSEILCVVGEAVQGAMAPGSSDDVIAEDAGVLHPGGKSWSVGSDEDDDTEDVSEDPLQTASGAGGQKKRRTRGGKKKSRKQATNTRTASSTSAGYTSLPPNPEFLPLPSTLPPPRPTSAPPHAAVASGAPQSALQKIDAIASNFHTALVPQCVSFSANPPTEKAKREFEHKKLTETILAQVLIRLDGVETGGDEEARGRRKALVREAQGVLNKLDEVVR
ncbi:hypothetical protein K432DRAFT_295821 [Lepidopterella palustris CBS 459.81]|uniref:BAG domain-containing protein n=1 Tax=Lepidopterella palustris CBS 459.81 TaxID=1314670 RepID=A0A8E2JGN9_9PEZI|nr:hypothetical protein K432DRAFT_295821 [Lepidopterella palustris CBS 459.81]